MVVRLTEPVGLAEEQEQMPTRFDDQFRCYSSPIPPGQLSLGTIASKGRNGRIATFGPPGPKEKYWKRRLVCAEGNLASLLRHL